jgi:hypothetical protein
MSELEKVTVYLSDDPLRSAAVEDRFHVAVQVLDARIHEHIGLRRCGKVTGRPGEHVVGVHRIEVPRHRPREDSSGRPPGTRDREVRHRR